MANPLLEELEELTSRATSIGDVQSAAIFFVPPGSSTLQLATAAGIEGPALEGLVAAVRNPDHPVARALTDEGPVFDVLPIAPGGPKLRSHLALATGRGEIVGVLAVAHNSPMDESQRQELIGLAEVAAAAIAR